MARLIAFYLALYALFFACTSSHALQWSSTPPTIELLKVATLPDGGERWVPKTITQTSIVPYTSKLPAVTSKIKALTYIRRIGANGSPLWAVASVALPVTLAVLDRYLSEDQTTGEPKYPGLEVVRERNISIPDGTFVEREGKYGTSYYIYNLGGYDSTQAEALAAAEAKKQQLVPVSSSVDGPTLLSSLGTAETTPTPIYDVSTYKAYRVRQYVPGTHGTTYDIIGWYFLYPITADPPAALDPQGVSDDLVDCFTDSCLETPRLLEEAIAAADTDLAWEDPLLDEPTPEIPYENDVIENPYDEGDPFGDRLREFSDNVKNAPLFASLWGFFDGPSLVGDPILDVNMGATFGGVHRVNFASWSSWLTTFKYIFLLIVTYSAIRIILRGSNG